MPVSPTKWTNTQLNKDIEKAAKEFRAARLAPTKAWLEQTKSAQTKFDELLTHFSDFDAAHVTNAKLADAFGKKLGEVMRYMAGPPISTDDLKVLADVDSVAPGVIKANPAEARKIYDVIDKAIDSIRFPWIEAKRKPTMEERSGAILASSVLLAAQRVATSRRSVGKSTQEKLVRDYLVTLGFKEVPTKAITTIVNGPQANEFCGECMLGDRKADIVVRLHDTRLLAIECKVSNSATNSVKRVNNDAAVKAVRWKEKFGDDGVVPSAMLSGVFKELNLVQAQATGLFLFWAHNLSELKRFIASTSPTVVTVKKRKK